MTSAGIYIHIPFCRTKCIYCDFYSVADQDNLIADFVNALVTEIESSAIDASNWNFDTIFIGGGTPSLVNPQQLEIIIDALTKKYNLSEIIEFTLEANPGEAPEQKLNDFRSLGVNRLSIGAQSFKPKLLKFLSRIHSNEDMLRTFEFARKVGFENINCDLIYNIPGQTLEDWQDDLNNIVQLNPEHISVYSLTVEQNTKLFELVSNGTITVPVDELHQKFNSITCSTLNNANFLQYEISNYAKLNRECLHNLHYWENDKYLGFGPSAHSFDGAKRWSNYRDLNKYIRLMNEGKSPIESIDRITEIKQTNEIIGFGIRMNKGFDIARIPRKFHDKFEYQLIEAQVKFPNMILEEKNHLKLNQMGMQFADAIAVELIL